MTASPAAILLASAFNSLSAAAAQCQSRNAILGLDSAQTLSGSLTIACPIQLMGGTIAVGANTLTMSGNVSGPAYLWLICVAGSVVTFSNNQVSNLKWFAAGNGKIDDTIACNAWANSSQVRYAPAAQYLTGTITLTANPAQGIVFGDAQNQTQFVAKTINADIFTFANMVSIPTFEFTNILGMWTGSGYSTGYVVHLPATLSFSFGVRCSFVGAIGIGCIKDEVNRVGSGTFSSRYEMCYVNNSGSHGFDIFGGPGVVLDTCYAHKIPNAGCAGYRIHAGARLSNCNGIDADPMAKNQYWGIFGDSTTPETIPAPFTGGPYTLAADPQTNYALVEMDNCNVEAFKTVGVVCKNGGVIVRASTDFISDPNVVCAAIFMANAPTATKNGQIENYSQICSLGTGASFANGCAVWQANSTVQFTWIGGSSLQTTVSIYDISNSAVIAVPTMWTNYIGYMNGKETFAQNFNILQAANFILGTQTPGSATAAGVIGQIAWDANYLYVCVAAHSWKRVAIGAW